MKKVLALALSAALLVGLLAGCGGKKSDILGTWELEMEMNDLINDQLAAADMDDFQIGSFAVTMDFNFKEDGTYTLQVNTDAMADAVDGLKEEMREGLPAYLERMLAEEGMEVTVDEFFQASGITLDEMVDTMFDAEAITQSLGDAGGEGNYQAKDGKLYLSDGLDNQVDPESYYTYTLKGDVMTLQEAVGEDSEFAGMFPMTLTRIG